MQLTRRNVHFSCEVANEFHARVKLNSVVGVFDAEGGWKDGDAGAVEESFFGAVVPCELDPNIVCWPFERNIPPPVFTFAGLGVGDGAGGGDVEEEAELGDALFVLRACLRSLNDVALEEVVLVDGEEDEDNLRVETGFMRSSEAELVGVAGAFVEAANVDAGDEEDDDGSISDESIILMGTRLRLGAAAVRVEGGGEIDVFGPDKSIGTRFYGHMRLDT